jgi:hypothetical protein
MRIVKNVLCPVLCVLPCLLTACGNPSSQQLASLTVAASPSQLNVGGTAMLTATAHLSDGTTQDVTSGTQFSLSQATLGTLKSNALTATSPGILTVSAAYVEAAPAGSSPASATTSPVTLSAATQITISQVNTSVQTPAILWNAPTAISYGTPLDTTQLNATANVAGTFTYTPAAGTVLKAGPQTLTTVFTPSDTKTYAPASASVQLMVGQAAPVVSWPTPAPVIVGTALSATQLDATTSVPGSFVYSPAIGAVPAAGVQLLTVVFSPTDTTDFTPATAHNNLTVTAAGTPAPVPVPTPVPTPLPTPTPMPTPAGCGGPTVNMNSGMSQSVLQSTISAAPACSLILFGPGTYSISQTLNIPCASKLTLSGAAAVPATAILAATFSSNAIFRLDNCTGVTIEYLHFENAEAVYMGDENNAGLTIRYNQITNLHGNSGIMIDGHLGTVVNNNSLNNLVSDVDIDHNTIGDAASCTSEIASIDYDGDCAGISTHVGELLRLTIEYNYILHVSEGIHIEQVGTYSPGSTNSVCVTCFIEYNYVLNYHRIGFENQASAPLDPIHVEHNVIDEPLNGFFGSMAMSMACCESGFIQQGYNGNSPSLYYNDNVTIDSGAGGGGHPPYGIEWWGVGAQGLNSLVQGNFSNGYVYGYGTGWTLENNYICGPYMATEGGYIANEEGVKNAPTEIGNVLASTCHTTPSVAPAISPAGGVASYPATVTLSETGQNTSIYYTTDGTTPVPGAGTTTLYTGPFQIPGPAKINAVGMWGVAPQPLTFPAGYGYVPSSVVTASFISGNAIRQPGSKVASGGVGQSSPGQLQPGLPAAQLTIAAGARSVTVGRTAQMKAIVISADGDSKDVTTEVTWTSSDARTVLVESGGKLSGLAIGKALITGSYGGHVSVVDVSSTLGAVSWSQPIVISQGGVYSGNWRSTDPHTPAVTVATNQPVSIANSYVSSAGDLIKVTVAGADVTVQNSIGLAVPSPTAGEANGIFLDAASPKRLTVENNYMDNVRIGILIRGYSGDHTQSQTLRVWGNRARNINGLCSNGAGGYLPGQSGLAATAHFIAMEGVQSVPAIDIGWNEVINYPLQSALSNVVDLYRSSGTVNQPLQVHDSYFQGAYSSNTRSQAYAGGGILAHGDDEDTAQNTSAFAYIHDNQVLATGGYGIAFVAGHDNIAVGNRVLASGLLPNNTRIPQVVGMPAGLVSRHAAQATAGDYNNSMHDNLVGWACWTAACNAQGNRNDLELSASMADYQSNNAATAAEMTPQQEDREYTLWLAKSHAAEITLGPTF